MNELGDRADIGIPAGDDRAHLEPAGECGFPALLDYRQLAAHVSVGADLEVRPDLARLDVWSEAERNQDVGLLTLDELSDLRRPDAVLHRGGTDLVALGQVLVAPDVNDLVERSDLGVPERGQLR